MRSGLARWICLLATSAGVAFGAEGPPEPPEFSIFLEVVELADKAKAEFTERRVVARGTPMTIQACLVCDGKLIAGGDFLQIDVVGAATLNERGPVSCIEARIAEDTYSSGGPMVVVASAPGTDAEPEMLEFTVVDIPSLTVSGGPGSGLQMELRSKRPAYAAVVTEGNGVTVQLAPEFDPEWNAINGALVLYQPTDFVPGDPGAGGPGGEGPGTGTAEADNDGITDNIDLNPFEYSSEFSDVSRGGTTFGRIDDRGDRTIWVTDISLPGVGVHVVVGQGSVDAVISGPLCDPPLTMTVEGGDEADFTLTCSTPTVALRSGELTVMAEGVDAALSVSISGGTTVTFEQIDPYTLRVKATGGDAALTVDEGAPVTVPAGAAYDLPFTSLRGGDDDDDDRGGADDGGDDDDDDDDDDN